MGEVCVVGLGIVGYPTALHILESGYDVFGYDIDESVKRKVKEFKVYSDWEETPVAKTYVICVNTDWNGKPEVSSLLDVCKKISLRIGEQLLSIESTVPVGTCRMIAEKFAIRHLVHVPHRYWALMPRKFGVKQTRVIGSLNNESLEIAEIFYRKLDIPLHEVSSLEVAEMIKIAENSYRYVQIAFAEELKMICDRAGLTFNEVKEGANTKWNVDILEAREGIKGSCLPKDICYLRHVADVAPLLLGAIRTDEMYRKYVDSVKASGR